MKALTVLKEKNPEWSKKVKVCFSDKCLGQIAAVETVWEGICVLLCWVHMKRNLNRELPCNAGTKQMAAKAIQYLDELRFAQSEEDFQALWNKVKKHQWYKKQSLKDYILNGLW